MIKNDKNDKVTKMTKMTKIFKKKKNCPKNNFTKKSINKTMKKPKEAN